MVTGEIALPEDENHVVTLEGNRTVFSHYNMFNIYMNFLKNSDKQELPFILRWKTRQPRKES